MLRTSLFSIIWLTLGLHSALAGEVAVAPDDTGTDVVEDTTDDSDSRSTYGPPRAPDVAELPAIPLADAVTAAGGVAMPITLLDTKVLPGTAARLSWSATELFEGVPVSTPVLVLNG
ncbi:MAG: hypothetical protein MJA83_01930, partial [Gammaproteobacteria bacterium]|nr:hypothetical protein [Gammaproteobacteria bacterium]